MKSTRNLKVNRNFRKCQIYFKSKLKQKMLESSGSSAGEAHGAGMRPRHKTSAQFDVIFINKELR